MKVRSMYIATLLVIACISCSKIDELSSLAKYNYQISSYKVTYELSDTSADVKTTLDITYQIGNTIKSDGFKFVGRNSVTVLSCRDECGRPLTCKVIPLKENRIEWYFPPSTRTSKRVTISCIMKDLLKTDANSSTLNAAWAGVFRVPVASAVYTVVFPAGYIPAIRTILPKSYSTNMVDGRYAISIYQSPLREKSFMIEFAR